MSLGVCSRGQGQATAASSDEAPATAALDDPSAALTAAAAAATAAEVPNRTASAYGGTAAAAAAAASAAAPTAPAANATFHNDGRQAPLIAAPAATAHLDQQYHHYTGVHANWSPSDYNAAWQNYNTTPAWHHRQEEQDADAEWNRLQRRKKQRRHWKTS